MKLMAISYKSRLNHHELMYWLQSNAVLSLHTIDTNNTPCDWCTVIPSHKANNNKLVFENDCSIVHIHVFHCCEIMFCIHLDDKRTSILQYIIPLYHCVVSN
eukprot:359408_1